MEYPDYLEPRYTLRQAAVAAAFPLNTLRSNYQRGWFRSFGKGMSVGRGRTQRLCLGDVLILAIASRLIDLGFSPLEAYNAPQPFGLVARQIKGEPKRYPFQLFDRTKFETLFVWRRARPSTVIGVKSGEPMPLKDLGLDDPFGEATVILPLNPIEATVFKALGVPLPETRNAG